MKVDAQVVCGASWAVTRAAPVRTTWRSCVAAACGWVSNGSARLPCLHGGGVWGLDGTWQTDDEAHAKKQLQVYGARRGP